MSDLVRGGGRRETGLPFPMVRLPASIMARLLFPTLLLMALWPFRALAQEPPPGPEIVSGLPAAEGTQELAPQQRLEALDKRIETLGPRVEAARRAAERADSLLADSLRRANQIPLDTIHVGPLRIATVPGQVETAEQVFSEVWQVFQPLIEGSEDLLSGQIFVFRYAWRMDGIYLEGDHVQSVEMNRRYGMDRLREKVRDGLGHVLVQALPESGLSIRDWVGMSPLNPPLDWSWIYRELAATPSTAVRRCFQGEASICWDALGLSDEEGGWAEWYSPEERRLLVKTRYSNTPRWEGLPLRSIDLLVHGCIGLESDRACLEILKDWPGAIPLSVSARASMVSEALSLGEEGAFTRLINSPDTSIVGRLSHAAQLPKDTLAARWRERVLLARPRAQAGILLSPLTLAFWILVLLFMATRSTRWRAG